MLLMYLIFTLAFQYCIYWHILQFYIVFETCQAHVHGIRDGVSEHNISGQRGHLL